MQSSHPTVQKTLDRQGRFELALKLKPAISHRARNTKIRNYFVYFIFSHLKNAKRYKSKVSNFNYQKKTKKTK